MTKPEPSFHLRMPKRLKDELQAARGRNSLNTEIVQRLERTVEPDPAMKIADILRPILANLDEEDQAKFASLVASAAEIVAKGSRKRRK